LLNRTSFGLVILVQQLLQGRLGFRVTQDAAGVSEDLNLHVPVGEELHLPSGPRNVDLDHDGFADAGEPSVDAASVQFVDECQHSYFP
jgi:hypothetical protein